MGALAGLTAALIGIGGAALSGAADAQQGAANLQAQLGVTTEEAQRLQGVANQLFAQGFTGSLTEAAGAIAETRLQLGNLADGELLDAAAGAEAIADTFGADMPQVLSSARTLMSTFGLTSSEALDFVTKGFQGGLNASGDFLDSVGEYSNLFADNGFSAEQFFSTMQTGLQGGALGTDKAADAFKEFGIRIQEMGDDIWGPDGSLRHDLEMTDEQIDELYNGMRDGSVTVADAYNELIPRLAAIEDPIVRNTVGVKLFGTQWEDMGANAILAIDMTRTGLADMAGATDGLSAKYTTFGAMWDVIWRRVTVALIPVGAAMLSLANQAMPYLMAALAWFETTLPGIIAGAQGVISAMVATVSGLLRGPLAGSVTSTGSTFQTIWSQVSSIVSSSVAIVSGILTGLAGFISANQGTILSLVTNAWSAISGLITGVLGFIQGILKAVLSAMQGDWAGAWQNIKQACESLVLGMWAVIKAAFENGKLILGTIAGAIKDKLVEVWGNAKDAVVTKAEELRDQAVAKVLELKDKVTGLAGEFLTAAKSVGQAIVDGIVNGITGAAGAIADAARGAAQSALDAAKDLLGIKSPSREAAAQIGLPFSQGIASGITQSGGLVTSAIADALMSAMVNVTPASVGRDGTTNIFNLTAQYANTQSEGSLRDDVRTLQLLGAGL